MRNEIAKTFGISIQQLKVFGLAFLGMFIVASLHYLGVQSPWKAPKLVLPIPAQKADTMNSLKPKLEQKPSTFSLKENASLIPQTYAADEMENLSAYAVIDLDTGEIIKAKNGNERLPIASLTKVMTAVTALDLADPSYLITIDQQAASMIPTKIGIVPGEKMRLEELLHASLMTSANDATQQIKNGIDEKYHDEIFIKSMNDKAAFLNLNNTHFANAEGFDSAENYSSVEDLARLTEYALTNYPLFASIVTKDYFVIAGNENHKQFDLYNWNGLIGVYPETHGIKIGNTDQAQKTTIVYSTRGGKKLVAVILGAPGITKRDLWAAKLLDIGYQQTLGLPPVNVTEEQLAAKYSTWQYWN
jgi:D-alanyl-D-alanine carboxypeptidase (penicillin-binding protein 5/6)